MAINFPSSPATNDTFVAGTITYKWDGSKWIGLGVTPTDRLLEGANSLEINASNNLVWTGNNVGIGITNPSVPLHITSADDIVLRVESTDRYSHIDLVDNTTTSRITTDGATGTLRLRADKDSAASGTAITFEVDGAEKARFNSSGVLDIDKASAAGLVVGGNGGGGDYHIEVGQLGTNGSGGINATGTSTALKFQLNGSDIARFDNAGRLLIGNTSATINEAKIEAYADNSGNADVLCLYNKDTATGNTANILFAPSNQVAGARIICEAMEDFSTSANRTADLSFVTRKDGTLSEKMRISGSGAITKTSNPAFMARYSTGVTTWNVASDGWTKIIFDDEDVDKGNNYDPSTGEFTAPVDGLYLFGAELQLEGPNGITSGYLTTGTNWMYISFIVNGQTTATLSEGGTRTDVNFNAVYNSYAPTHLMNLSAGDTVCMYRTGNYTSIKLKGGSESVFWGYLVG